MQLSDAVETIPGVGAKTQQVFNGAGIYSIGDLLHYLPTGYEDSTEILSLAEAIKRISHLPLWQLSREKFAIKGKLRKISSFKTKRRFALTTAYIVDEQTQDTLQTIWFNMPFVTTQLKVGTEYVFFGKVKRESAARFTLSSPQFEEYNSEKTLQRLGRISPVYRRIKTLKSPAIARTIRAILPKLEVSDFLSGIIDQHEFSPLTDAYWNIHSPASFIQLNQGVNRLKLQELLELRDEFEKKKQASTHEPFKMDEFGKKVQELINSWVPLLPFTLTKGQQEILDAYMQKVQQKSAEDTFLYGDVGSGKTIIAQLVALAYAVLGKSALILVPTTILSRQHALSTKQLIERLQGAAQVKVEEVTATRTKRTQSFQPHVIYIGTQAILYQSELIAHPLLAFVCIDEQHRFGVEQRLLFQRGNRNVLTLSATPIPRTLALSFMQFTEALFLEEKPYGRKEILSRVVPQDKHDSTYTWIAEKVKKGEQAYIIFPRITSEDDEKKSLIEMFEMLSDSYFSGCRVGMLHGGMKQSEKESIMTSFAEGNLDILCATSVVEVGVDVPNATIIAIHGAEYFGLAQLHQLRGRVGRSNQQSYCFLIPSRYEDTVIERLEFFTSHHKGSDVATYDLQRRGAGKLLGIDQSGVTELKIASLEELPLIEQAMRVYSLLREKHISVLPIIRVK